MAPRLRLLAIALLGLAVLPAPVRADDAPRPADLVFVPAPCAQFWTIPGGARSPVAWSQVISFAACIQDASVLRLQRPERAPALVGQLRMALGPSVELYMSVIERGPGPARVRAAFHLASAYASLITRARASLAPPTDEDAPRLRAALEPLLARPAEMAYLVYIAVAEAVTGDPTLAPDQVTRGMVRAAREQAAILEHSGLLPRPEVVPAPVYTALDLDGSGVSR